MCAQFFRGFVTFCFLSIKKLPYQISPIQQFPHLLIYQLCKNTCTSFTAQWQCPPQLPQLPLQPFPLFLSFTMLLIARPAIATTIAPTTTVPILYSFPVTRNAFARDFCLLLQTLYKISPTNIIMIYIVSIF